MLSPLARHGVAPHPGLSNVEQDHPMELGRRDFPMSPGDTLKF
jgi:hypothetical protein